MKTIAIAVCLLECEDQIALIKFKRNYLAGYWGLPGGKFEDNEYLPEAAERETREEVEVDVKFDRLCGLVDEIVEHPEGNMRILMYICTVQAVGQIKPRRIDKPEGIIEWFTHSQLAKLESQINTSDFRTIQHVLAGTLPAYTKCRQRVTAAGVELVLFEPVG